MKKNIYIWNISKINNKFYFNTYINNYKLIHKLSKGYIVKFRVHRKYGLPFIIYKYRKRIGLITGFSLFIVFIMIMSEFIWVIEIHGNKTINTSQLINFISSKKIRPGKFRKNIDVRSIERETLLKFKNISWISINIVGSKAIIEINECTLPPKNIDSGAPCNIIASKSGIIDHIEAYQGQNIVDIGDFVKKGQLLVSGILEDTSLNNYIVHSRAKAIARVEETHIFSHPLKFQKTKYSTSSTNLYLEIFNHEIPVNFTKKIDSEIKHSYSTVYPKILDISLPFKIKKQYNKTPSQVYFNISKDQAKKNLLSYINNCESQMKNNNIKIISKQIIQDSLVENNYIIKIKYITLEDIAKPQDIIIETQPDNIYNEMIPQNS